MEKILFPKENFTHSRKNARNFNYPILIKQKLSFYSKDIFPSKYLILTRKKFILIFSILAKRLKGNSRIKLHITIIDGDKQPTNLS